MHTMATVVPGSGDDVTNGGRCDTTAEDSLGRFAESNTTAEEKGLDRASSSSSSPSYDRQQNGPHKT